MNNPNDSTRKETAKPERALPSASGSGCGDGVKLWRADRTEIKLVNCPRGAWPEADEDGKTAYINTHFKTPEEAWEKVEREAESWVGTVLRDISETTKQLEKLKSELVAVSLQRFQAQENRQSWNRHNAESSHAGPVTTGLG